MSQFSQTSTIPYENSQDPSFLNELEEVDNLYFRETEDFVPSLELNDFSVTSDDIINDDSDCEDSSETTTESFIEPSVFDINERNSIDSFKTKTCGCSRLYGKPCSNVVNFDDLLSLREYASSLENRELDLVIKATLLTHRQNGPCTSSVAGHKSKERQRSSQRYFIKGIEVCRQVFCFSYCIGTQKLVRIGQSLDEEELVARTHGNKSRLPNNVISFVDNQEIVNFLQRYAQENALPLPGRMPNHREFKVLLLPADKRRSDVHENYLEIASLMGLKAVSLSSFSRIWRGLCPHIVLTRPKTDLCHKCQMWTYQISNSGCLSETDKLELIEKYKDHVNQADIQRKVYRAQCEEAKEHFNVEFVEGSEPCSLNARVHYSWDFAQQVFIPHHSQQVGPLFFKTPRKCEVFGVCCEGSEKQVFYLADEGVAPGKGANTVVNYLHHYLKHYGFGEKDALFHFDNCSSQNKNNAVLGYAMWRVMTGLHQSISYNLMIAGHTKFTPDMHFGIWKSRWRRVDAETIQDVAHSVRDSSKNGHNVPHIVDDPANPVEFYDWKTFLSQYFKPLKNITKYHSYRVLSAEPGTVICKEFEDSTEQTFVLLKKGVKIEPTDFPEKIVSPGLDLDRQWYLYDEIRPFIKHACAKEKTSPLPKSAKPNKKLKKC